MIASKNKNEGSSRKQVHLVLTRRVVFALGIVLLVPWLLISVLFWKSSSPQRIIRHSRPPVSQKAMVTEGKPGPWGQLQYTYIATEMPDEFAFVAGFDVDAKWWYFKDYNMDQALEFLKSSGLSSNDLAALAKPDKWETVEDGCRVKPGSDLVLGMSPGTRGKIYLHLALFAENKAQRAAFSFYPERLQERFASSDLSDKSIALFNSLLYKQGAFLLFSDFGYALAALSDDDERRLFIKMISRKTTFLAKLKISPDSDVDRLVGYWGGGGRAKDLHPLLESMTKVDGDSYLDIVHLLPRFARERLYTYPVVSANARSSNQDCNWSTMNFMNFAPDDKFSNTEYLAEKLSDDYYQIGFPERLGDLVFLVLPSYESVHSAVFIADNIVFTKNGESVSQPWFLMKMEDMIELYSAPLPSEYTLKPLFYRRKNM